VKPLLSVRNVSYAYGARSVFQDVSFNLFPTDTIALMGANGAGKTTLLKICAGLLTPHRGEVLYLDKPLSSYKRREIARSIALVPQEVQVTFDFTVQQFVEQGRTPHLSSLFGSLQDNDRSAIWRAMECADVTHLAHRNFNELSGGERQRVKIALAIAQEPRLLLLDEPTQHLDIGRQAEVFAVLRRLNESGIAVVAAVHDLQSALAHFPTGMLISPGSPLLSGPTAEVLNPSAVRQAFGVALPGTAAGWDVSPLGAAANRS
jgi:ABC-type cobalamin/Fe3+-siderophores transport system ATPase subunit